jgi:hypothetical protein
MHVEHKEHLADVHDIFLCVLLFFPSKSEKQFLLNKVQKKNWFKKKRNFLLIIHWTRNRWWSIVTINEKECGKEWQLIR